MASSSAGDWRFTSRAAVSDFSRSLSTSDEVPKPQHAPETSLRRQETSLIHLLDLLHPLRAADNVVKGNIPPIFKEPDAVDAATPVGRGASFTVTQMALPEGPDRLESLVRSMKGSFTTQRSYPAPPRPKIIAYKTANLRFVDDGNVHPDDQMAAKSILTEFDCLTYGPLLRNANVVDYLGFCWATNPYDASKRLPALIVEYAEFGSLAALQRTSVMTGAEKKSICLDVARGLDAVHRAGMVHGDVKSENVLVFSHPSRRFVAKIGDFGFSRFLNPGEALVRLGGTRPWTAPEIEGPVRNSLLTKTDIYSFGLLALVVSVDGANPFELLLPWQSADIQSRASRTQQIETYKKSTELEAALKTPSWLTAHLVGLCMSLNLAISKQKFGAFMKDKAALVPVGQAQKDLALLLQTLRANIARGDVDFHGQLNSINEHISKSLLSAPSGTLYPCLDAIWSCSIRVDPDERDLSTILRILSDEHNDTAGKETPQISDSRAHTNTRTEVVQNLGLTAVSSSHSQTAPIAAPTKNLAPSNQSPEFSHNLDVSNKVKIHVTNTSDEAKRYITTPVSLSQPVEIEGHSANAGIDKLHESRRGDRNVSWQHVRTLAASVQCFLVDHYPKVRSQERFSLGGLHINGYGTAKDAEKGCRLIRSSAQSGDKRAKAFAYRLHQACRVSLPAEFPWEDYLFELAQMGSGPALQDLQAVNKARAGRLHYYLLHLSSHFIDACMLNGRFINSYLSDGSIIDIAKSCDSAKEYIVNISGHGLIHVAASLANHVAIKTLVEQFAIDINQQSRNGETALLCAIRSGSGKVAALILQSYHADASIESKTGESPLHWLIEFEDQWIEPLGKDLLANGGNVNAMTNARIQYSRIDSGIDIDFKMPGTPLAFAVHKNRPKIVQWLLQNGAEPELHSTLSLISPLHWAAYYHRHECLRIIIEELERRHANSENYANSDARHAVYYTHLVTSAFDAADRFSMIMRNGDKYLECLHKTLDLLREKTKLINVDFGRSTPLLSAAEDAHDEILDYLLDTKWGVVGLEPEYSPDGQLRAEGLNTAGGPEKLTPILQAVRSNRRPMFDKLLNHGANVCVLALNPFEPSQQNFSALHIFAYEGHRKDVTLITTLIGLGVPIDGVPTEDTSAEPVYATETPLGIALRRSALPQATLLLAHGADINALASTTALTRSSQPLTVLGLAIAANLRSSAPRIATMLSRLPSKPSFIVEPTRRLSALHRCARANADLSDIVTGMPRVTAAWDSETNRAIMLELVRVFDTREQLDAPCGIAGSSALHLAVAAANAGAVEVLVSAGASVCVVDDAGRSVVDYARAAATNGGVALQILRVVERAWMTEREGAAGDLSADAGLDVETSAGPNGAGGQSVEGKSVDESSSSRHVLTPETSTGDPATSSAMPGAWPAAGELSSSGNVPTPGTSAGRSTDVPISGGDTSVNRPGGAEPGTAELEQMRQLSLHDE